MKTRKKIAFKIFQWLITAMVALIILIPIYWIFISSIKPNEDLFTMVNSNPRIPFVTQDSLFVNENPVL